MVRSRNRPKIILACALCSEPMRVVSVIEEGPVARKILDPEGGPLGLPADFLIDARGKIPAGHYGSYADDDWFLALPTLIHEVEHNQLHRLLQVTGSTRCALALDDLAALGQHVALFLASSWSTACAVAIEVGVRLGARLVVALVLLAARPASAQVPALLFDALDLIHEDLYDFAPEEQAEWEASRYSAGALRLNDGSATPKEVLAELDGQANVRPLPWLGFHFDLRDDRTRQAEVARFSADLLVRASSWLEVGASGSPDVLKDQSAWGGVLLAHSEDRKLYAVIRLLQDRPLYNLKNLEGGRRDGVPLRAQLEARGELGPASVWVRADTGSPSRIAYPLALPSAVQAAEGQRSDLDLHFRYRLEGGGLGCAGCGLGLRVSARSLDNDVTSHQVRNQLRLGLVRTRASALLRLGAAAAGELRMRAVLLWGEERARGLASGDGYTVVRHDVGGRLAGVWSRGPLEAEAGWAALTSVQRFAGAASPGPFDAVTPVDKVYLLARLRLSPRATVRLLASHQLVTGRFAGFGGSLLVIF